MCALVLQCSDLNFHPAHMEFNNNTPSFFPKLLQLPYQHKHKIISDTRVAPTSPTFTSSCLIRLCFFLLDRSAKTKKMSRSWFILRVPVHSSLLHHYPLGENHRGNPRHRDQRNALLLPDALCYAANHLSQVSMTETKTYVCQASGSG